MLRLAMSDSHSGDEQAIRDLMDTWLRATTAGDLNTVLTLMSDDAVFLVPGQPLMRGKHAFAAAFHAMVPVVRIEAAHETEEIQVHGDIAWCWSRLSVTITPRSGGQPSHRTGHTLSILRREPTGNWVVIRDANLLAPG
jgi:uncharacterized protein (TIGR02246 family)